MSDPQPKKDERKKITIIKTPEREKLINTALKNFPTLNFSTLVDKMLIAAAKHPELFDIGNAITNETALLEGFMQDSIRNLTTQNDRFDTIESQLKDLKQSITLILDALKIDATPKPEIDFTGGKFK